MNLLRTLISLLLVPFFGGFSLVSESRKNVVSTSDILLKVEINQSNLSKYFIEKLKIDKNLIGDKLTTKYRRFDVEFERTSKKEESSLKELVVFRFKNKEKRYLKDNNGYSESNHCLEEAESYDPTNTKGIRKRYFYCGRTLEIDFSWNTAREVCWDFDKEHYSREDCRDEAIYLSNEELKIPKNDASKCSYRCYDMIPFLDKGEYEVLRENVRLREKPSRDSKVLGVLKKGQSLQVLEDTGIIEEIEENVAPWVKVSTQSGIEGYVFGALIKVPGELRF